MSQSSPTDKDQHPPSASTVTSDPSSTMRLPSSTSRTYKDAINALNTLQSNFASIEANRKLGPNVDRHALSLNEVVEYTRRLGYSCKDFNKLNIIHITGTKGKGSTCAFTESILKQYLGVSPTIPISGSTSTPVTATGAISSSDSPIKKIGLFTSPHLKSVRERIRINGNPINELKFTKYFFEVWDKLSSTTSSPEEWPTLQPCNQIKPMYFKYLTILSFHVFMQEGIDTAIYEVGVGGKYDSTNIIDKPTVTGISSLGIDHTFMLGNTIDSITWNKTGIFKPSVPAVISQQLEYPESIELIRERAEELKVSNLEIIKPLSNQIKLGLAGDFQRQNAALAVRLATIHLTKLGFDPKDLPQYNKELEVIVDEDLPEGFINGLIKVNWDGRCQIIRDKPGFDKITWYIDGAHTLESINVSSTWFKTELSNLISKDTKTTNKKRTKILLFNQQSRENASALLTKLYDNTSPAIEFDHVIFTTNITWSDGKYNSDLVSLNNSQELVDKLIIQKGLAQTWSELDAKSKRSHTRKHIFHDIETGVNFIKSLTKSNENSDVEVFVCGSLHLVGGFLVVLDDERD